MTDNIIIPSDSSDRSVTERTNEELERDRVIVARMYVRGKSQHEMLMTINSMYPDRPISSKTINHELQVIRNSWLNSTLVDFNSAKAKELARLDEMEKEAWDAWERSKEKHIRIEYDVADDQVPFSVDKIANVTRKRKHKIIEATVGDIRYLTMIESAIKMRCDIFGLFEAKKVQVDWRIEAQAAGLDNETIEAVKERTVQTLLEAITQSARDSGMVKEQDIIDVTEA
ncbi:hypothetical protein MUP59_00610 [Candidatus Bathyarchaeota archaeon]|nr:hypothetical protein [Candidatus Bathyarchaeota archaeon]